MKAKILVTLKDGVLDPQGKAVEHALRSLGFSGVEEVRQGKLIELTLSESSSDAALSTVTEMCETLLANTIIENYNIEFRET